MDALKSGEFRKVFEIIEIYFSVLYISEDALNQCKLLKKFVNR